MQKKKRRKDNLQWTISVKQQIHELEQNKLVDWENIILRLLHSQFNDWRVNPFFIDLLPVDYGLKILEYLSQHQIDNWNALSKTNAIGWAAIINGFGGTNTPWTELLPVTAQDKKEQVKSGFESPTSKTLEVIRMLVNQQRLSIRIQNAILNTGVKI